jgi:hypothetical protein
MPDVEQRRDHARHAPVDGTLRGATPSGLDAHWLLDQLMAPPARLPAWPTTSTRNTLGRLRPPG